MATTHLTELGKRPAVAAQTSTPTDSQSAPVKKTEQSWWAIPVIVVGFGPCLVFDFVTFPIQAGIGLREWDRKWSGH